MKKIKNVYKATQILGAAIFAVCSALTAVCAYVAIVAGIEVGNRLVTKK